LDIFAGLPPAAESPIPEARGRDILIHVGPHKTGSSWLQNRFFPHVPGIVYEGRARDSHAAFLVPDFGDFSPEAVREIYLGALERAQAEDKPLVISDEALGGRPFHQKFFRAIAAYRLRAAFPQARILVVARAQEAVIQSMYGEYLRYGYASSLEGFLAQQTGNPAIAPLLDLDYYDWDRVQDFYEEIFGAAQVRVVPMELMLSDTAALSGIVETLLGRAIGVPETLPTGQPERPALSAWAQGFLRLANHLQPQDSRYRVRRGKLNPYGIAHRIDALTPAAARRAGKLRARSLIEAHLGDRFVASNRRFAARNGYDLAALGYKL